MRVGYWQNCSLNCVHLVHKWFLIDANLKVQSTAVSLACFIKLDLTCTLHHQGFLYKYAKEVIKTFFTLHSIFTTSCSLDKVVNKKKMICYDDKSQKPVYLLAVLPPKAQMVPDLKAVIYNVLA